MPQITFETFAVRAPRGWGDITDELEADEPAHTLAYCNGVGALQFSVALHHSGPAPDQTPEVLRGMVEEFGRARALGEPSAVVVEQGPPRLAAGSFACAADFLRVWYVSDGRNVAFITYTCASAEAGPELPACEQIVRSLEFRPT